ncbi:unnamed protein product [Phytomonas sp. EM1]|nr:unnamed protein product [Phytomonas sp. EM1]|eukprot:CCW60590.1 unnamed protein product [Phytomonas sp. isolate EM1]
MVITDSCPAAPSPAAALRQRCTETLRVEDGPRHFAAAVHFHPYDLFKTTRRRVQRRSVGYTPTGDLVLTREEISDTSDGDLRLARRGEVVISQPTVLDPAARRARRYPGVYAPRNKKRRNRLLNDYFATPMGIALLEQSRTWRGAANAKEEDEEDDDDDDGDGARRFRPFFVDLPPALLRSLGRGEEEKGAEGGRPPPPPPPPRDPDAAEVRFQALHTRLRGELHHALNSEFLHAQIEDLDVCFTRMLQDGETSEVLVFRFRDGYGRLLCHAVAAYYQLVSESRQLPDGMGKLTYVAFPRSKKGGVRVPNLPQLPLIHVLRGYRGRMPARHPLSGANSPLPGGGVDSPPRLKEPISPLMLGESSAGSPPFSHPPPFSLLENPASAANRRPLVNTTVLVMNHASLRTEEVEIEVYAPQFRISDMENGERGDGGAQDEPDNGKEDAMLSFSSQFDPMSGKEGEFGSITPPLTATQRKKLKKAEKARAATQQTASPHGDSIDTKRSPGTQKKGEA